MTDELPPPGAVDPRVSLAVERTLLAWIRTGVSLMGFGFVVARFALLLREVAGPSAQTSHGGLSAPLTGVGIVTAGIAVNLWAAIRHSRMIRHIARGEYDVLSLRGPVAVAAASCIGGALLVLVLLGIFRE